MFPGSGESGIRSKMTNIVFPVLVVCLVFVFVKGVQIFVGDDEKVLGIDSGDSYIQCECD